MTILGSKPHPLAIPAAASGVVTHGSPSRLPAHQLREDLLSRQMTLAEIARKYGVSKQWISQWARTRGLPTRAIRRHEDRCSICQKIIEIAKDPNTSFISKQTLARKLRIRRERVYHHLRYLRWEKLIPHDFAFIWSPKVEKAYRLYLTKAIPVVQIGRLTGVGNFACVIHQHRHKGGHVIPPSLFVYDHKQRSKRARRKRKIIGKD